MIFFLLYLQIVKLVINMEYNTCTECTVRNALFVFQGGLGCRVPRKMAVARRIEGLL